MRIPWQGKTLHLPNCLVNNPPGGFSVHGRDSKKKSTVVQLPYVEFEACGRNVCKVRINKASGSNVLAWV